MNKKYIIISAIAAAIVLIAAAIILVLTTEGSGKSAGTDSGAVLETLVIQPEGEAEGKVTYPVSYSHYSMGLLLSIKDEGAESWEASVPEGAGCELVDVFSEEDHSEIYVIPAKSETVTVTAKTAFRELAIELVSDKEGLVTSVKVSEKILEGEANEALKFMKAFCLDKLPDDVTLIGADNLSSTEGRFYSGFTGAIADISYDSILMQYVVANTDVDSVGKSLREAGYNKLEPLTIKETTVYCYESSEFEKIYFYEETETSKILITNIFSESVADALLDELTGK